MLNLKDTIDLYELRAGDVRRLLLLQIITMQRMTNCEQEMDQEERIWAEDI